MRASGIMYLDEGRLRDRVTLTIQGTVARLMPRLYSELFATPVPGIVLEWD
jgi:hypothetical protein